MKSFSYSLISIVIVVVIAVPLIHHVVWCITSASEKGSAVALLIAGLILPPVGWGHGVSLFFGATWI